MRNGKPIILTSAGDAVAGERAICGCREVGKARVSTYSTPLSLQARISRTTPFPTPKNRGGLSMYPGDKQNPYAPWLQGDIEGQSALCHREGHYSAIPARNAIRMKTAALG